MSGLRFRKSDARWLSVMLVLALLLGSLPVSTGVVLTYTGQPTLSLDLCHPLESARINVPTIVARPAPDVFIPLILEFERVSFSVPHRRAGLQDAPDTPPPEVLI